MSNSPAPIIIQFLKHTICCFSTLSNPLLIQLRFWLWISSLLILLCFTNQSFFTLSRGQPRGTTALKWSSSKTECFDLSKIISAELRDKEQHEPPFPHIYTFHSNGPKMLSPVSTTGSWPRVQAFHPTGVRFADSLTNSFTGRSLTSMLSEFVQTQAVLQTKCPCEEGI